MNLILILLISVSTIRNPNFDHMTIPMLLLRSSVMFPVVPLNSSGMLTLYEIFICLSLCTTLLSVSTFPPAFIALVLNTNVLSHMCLNLAVLLMLRKLLYMSVNSRSVDATAVPLHCLSKNITIRTDSCVNAAASVPVFSTPMMSKFRRRCICVMVIFRPIRCDAPVPCGMSTIVTVFAEGPAPPCGIAAPI